MHKTAVLVVEMHAVALAVSPRWAGGAFALFCPTAVSILLKAVVPDLPEVVFVYISLVEIGTDTCAA